MIYWNERTLKSTIGSWVWNLTEYFGIGLGKYAPIVFGWMIGSKPNKLKNKRNEKHCRICSRNT